MRSDGTRSIPHTAVQKATLDTLQEEFKDELGLVFRSTPSLVDYTCVKAQMLYPQATEADIGVYDTRNRTTVLIERVP